MARAMKSTEEEVFIPGDENQRAWRDWVASQFNTYAAKIGGLQGLNLVAGAFRVSFLSLCIGNACMLCCLCLL